MLSIVEFIFILFFFRFLCLLLSFVRLYNLRHSFPVMLMIIIAFHWSSLRWNRFKLEWVRKWNFFLESIGLWFGMAFSWSQVNRTLMKVNDLSYEQHTYYWNYIILLIELNYYRKNQIRTFQWFMVWSSNWVVDIN